MVAASRNNGAAKSYRSSSAFWWTMTLVVIVVIASSTVAAEETTATALRRRRRAMDATNTTTSTTQPEHNYYLNATTIPQQQQQQQQQQRHNRRNARDRSSINKLKTKLLHGDDAATTTASSSTAESTSSKSNPPNVLIFLVDDLGYNQVGYHAHKVGNTEIQTPNIDAYAADGLILNRGYMTPWCGPSRAALMTGRTNSYNANISSSIASFDDDIGFVAGLPYGTQSLAHAFKEYGTSINKPYQAYYNGKWGIGGTAWTNTALGLGFDEFRGFWGNGIEPCDGMVPTGGATVAFRTVPTARDYGPVMVSALPGYWEQDPDMEDTEWCTALRGINDGRLTEVEKDIACKTRPRTPPKHVDLDLLDKVKDQIANHDYDKGSFLQVYATAMMHLPIAYPDEYNEDPSLPDYFRSGATKPPPSIDDLRMATNMGVKFLDDLFGSTMQALKDAGQWDNTIVFFTSDNGGAIYNGSANNNYPLRSSKFTPFEGGVRVVQFFSGGWVEKNLPSGSNHVSNTYLFPSDIGPTLLEMAGGNKDLLLRGLSGPTYGNSMWQYLKNSVDTTTSKETHQLVRKVSFNKDIYFDVQIGKTMKHVFMGKIPQWTPRLWDPIWPKNGDLVMDSAYYSVQPCRPNGVPSDCCLFNIETDWQENYPIATNCQALSQTGKELFVIENGCPKDSEGRHMNPLCIEPGGIDDGASPSKFSLWSHYGATGPFTNSKGVPIDDFSMKCACLAIESSITKADANFFTLPVFSPTECVQRNELDKLIVQGVRCDGNFSFASPLRDMLKEFAAQAFDIVEYSDLIAKEISQRIALDLPGLVDTLRAYTTREGFQEWPNFGKFPFVIDKLDTCKEKGIAPVPWPVESMTPYMLGIRDPTIPRLSDYKVGLCALNSLNIYFCPSHQNPLLQPVQGWDYGNRIFDKKQNATETFGQSGSGGLLFGSNGLFGSDRDWGLLNKPGGLIGRRPYGTFTNGKLWRSLNLAQCALRCRIRAKGTAYIGDGPHGLKV